MTKDELRWMMEKLGLENIKDQGTQVSSLCPFHSETRNSFAISPDKLLWNCFKCGGGPLLLLVTRLRECDPPEARKFIEKFGEYDIIESAKWEYLFSTKKVSIEQSAMAAQSPSLLAPYIVKQRRLKAIEYLKGRGIRFNGQECVTGNVFGYDPKQERVLFPWHDDKNLFFGCTGRLTYNSENIARYMPYFGLQKGHHLYAGMTDWSKKKSVSYLLVENEISAIRVCQLYDKLGIMCFATGTARITEWQTDLLRKESGPFIAGQDIDEGGEQGAEKFSKWFGKVAPVSRVTWPCKSPHDCTDKQLLHSLKNYDCLFS